MPERNRKRHDDEAGKGKIQVHEGIVRRIRDVAILNTSEENKKFGLVMWMIEGIDTCGLC